MTHLEQNVDNILSAESKDGRAQNVVRFSNETLRTIKPGDSFKAESGRKAIQQMLDEVTAKLQEIVNLRSHIFDKNLTVKQWRANELKFIDAKKSLLEDLANVLQKTLGTIITNTNLLKRRTNATAEQGSEAKRQRRSSNRNARKSMKEKEARFQSKIKDVVCLLTKGTFTLDELNKRENHEIHLAGIDKSCQLVARFHFKAMIWLTENGYFSQDALEYANKPTENLSIQLQRSKDMTTARKRKFAAQRSQKTLFDCLDSGKKLPTGVSTAEEPSDDD